MLVAHGDDRDRRPRVFGQVCVLVAHGDDLDPVCSAGLCGGLPFLPMNFDCSQREGQVWWGCGSYGQCQGGQYSQVDCVNGTVFNRQTRNCSQ